MTKQQKVSALREHAALFAKTIRPVYVALNWEWANDVGKTSVPSAEEIERTLRRLIDSVETSGRVQTGGLEVYIDDDAFGFEFARGLKCYDATGEWQPFGRD